MIRFIATVVFGIFISTCLAPAIGMAGNGQFAIPLVFGNVAGAMQQMQQQQYQMQQQQIIVRQQAGAAWLQLGQPILSCIAQNYRIEGPQFGYTYGIFPGDYRYVGMVQQCAAIVVQEQQRQQEAERQRRIAEQQERIQQAEQKRELALEQEHQEQEAEKQRQISLQRQQQDDQDRKTQEQQTQQRAEADAIRAQQPNALSQMWSGLTGSSEEKACLDFNDNDSTLAMLCAGGHESNTALIGNVMIPLLEQGKYSIKMVYINNRCYADARIAGNGENGFSYEWKDICPFSVKSYQNCIKDSSEMKLACWYKSMPTNEERADENTWRKTHP